MKSLLMMTGITKQALHKHNGKQSQRLLQEQALFEAADLVREEHPMMGCRKMSLLLNKAGMGRDRCEELLLGNGYRVRYAPNYIKTTVSQKFLQYPNLIEGLKVYSINRVWQTDISYFILSGEVYYLVFIIDVYSRMIVGYAANNHMQALANIQALKKAFALRNQHSLSGLIHHSDRGSQYIDKKYTALLREQNIAISMCKQAWENAYTERINGTIKNEYLKAWKIKNLASLQYQVRRAVYNYNHTRPHDNLPKRMSPASFEKYLQLTAADHHPVMSIYKHPSSVEC